MVGNISGAAKLRGAGSFEDRECFEVAARSLSTVMPMEIVLVRHGEPEWVRDGLNVVNPPLTDRGHLQASRLAEALQSESFDEILVSPLTRARQTAAPLARRPRA